MPEVEIIESSHYFYYFVIWSIVKARFFYHQFKALTVKRVLHTLRNKILILSQIVVPIACLLIILIYLKYAPIKPVDSPILYINLTRYRSNYVPYGLAQSENTTYLNDFESVFKSLIDANDNTQAFNLNDNKTVSMCNSKRQSVSDYLICVGRMSINYITDNYLIGASFKYDNDTDKLTLIGHFNNQPFHVPPLALNTLTNTLLNHFSNSNYKITVINHPLPRNLKEQINDLKTKDATGFNVATNITFGFSFLIASFAMFLIKERVSGKLKNSKICYLV
jgi:ATP-binding cassette subfamily A (ABC1) protein 3